MSIYIYICYRVIWQEHGGSLDKATTSLLATSSLMWSMIWRGNGTSFSTSVFTLLFFGTIINSFSKVFKTCKYTSVLLVWGYIVSFLKSHTRRSCDASSAHCWVLVPAVVVDDEESFHVLEMTPSWLSSVSLRRFNRPWLCSKIYASTNWPRTVSTAAVSAS